MKITDLKIRELNGVMEHPDPFWEERLVRPVDIYPDFRTEGANYSSSLGDGRYAMRSAFLEIHTDDGVIGFTGPFSRHEAFIIDTQLRGTLVGSDPLASEMLWDQMYRKIPAYASALGFSIEPEAAVRRAKEFVEQGYTASKWFFRDGPTDGKDGVRRNLELAETLRNAVGPDVDIMLDAWSSWDVPYSIKMSQRLAEYDIRWLEEPVLADKLDSYIEIQRSSAIPISGGEHEYTRWGFRPIVENKAMDILQPDIFWCGGISEMLKICAMASAFALPVIPHGHSSHATAHLIASQSPVICPIQEFLIKWNSVHQFFLEDQLIPENGIIKVPQGPGLGLAIDEDKVTEEKELNFRDI